MPKAICNINGTLQIKGAYSSTTWVRQPFSTQLIVFLLQDLQIGMQHNFRLAKPRFSQSEVMLHSDASKYRKGWRTRYKTVLKNGW